MDLAELLADARQRSREFPVVEQGVFLAHAAVSPLPRRVSEAIHRYAVRCSQGDQEEVAPERVLHQTRELAARLLSASPEEIALVGPTSLALSLVAGGLSFRAGENVVIYFDDYPANVYPWQALAERGVQVRRLQARQLGRIAPEQVLAQVDEQTRLVALASCHFVSGFRPDLTAIGQELHQRNILFCVDGIQTLGAFPTPVEHIDFLAADAHKWLLGPCGAGLLYVRKSVQPQLRPLALGWHNVRCPDFVAQEQMLLRPDARRYEPGTANLLGVVGLHAALELLLEVGVENIASELLRKRAWVLPALAAKGYIALEAEARPESASGIVSFHRPGADMRALHRKLRSARVITSLRADRAGNRYLRLSPHFYNTDEELARLLELLGDRP